jgi:hypothetical protein
MTLQLAPGIPASKRRPAPGTLPEWGFHWYKNLTYGDNVTINPFFYGTYLGSTKPEEPSKSCCLTPTPDTVTALSQILTIHPFSPTPHPPQQMTVFRAKDEAYQCDALSSMLSLNDSYWKTMHKFRLEWQPGPQGYVHWYVDGKFRFGVEQEGLDEMRSKVPQEPSYVIMNTAISTSWGFPNPPWGCTEYDCKDPEARCGFNSGFCQTLPAEFLIDYVRVYQNKADKYQSVGCNPPDFPTRKFILAHEYRYKGEDESHATKATVAGGGGCRSDTECGGVYGTGYCSFRRCLCNEDWTGPNCLVPAYKDEGEDWEKDWITFALPQVPPFLATCMFLLVGLLASATYYIIFARRTGFIPVSGGVAGGGNDHAKAPGWL